MHSYRSLTIPQTTPAVLSNVNKLLPSTWDGFATSGSEEIRETAGAGGQTEQEQKGFYHGELPKG